jgi:hypothetical protein
MRLPELIQRLPFVFSSHNVAEELGLKKTSADKLCQRYVLRGVFVRLKRDRYLFERDLITLSHKRAIELSSVVQEGTYVSCVTALQHHGICSGQAYGIEAVGTQRSFESRCGSWRFRYYRFPQKYVLPGAIATAEKALLDLFYLQSLGRYPFPMKRIRRHLLSLEKMRVLAALYPKRVQLRVERLWKSNFGVAPVPGPTKSDLRRAVLRECGRF